MHDASATGSNKYGSKEKVFSPRQPWWIFDHVAEGVRILVEIGL